MALGRRRGVQQPLFIATEDIVQSPSHPFYSRLEAVFRQYGFDTFCEALCRPYYAEVMGRPGLAPGVYFRLLLLGYFERIPSERQIAWRVADAMSLRQFIGYPMTQPTPDHSTISKTRRRLPLSVHTAVFTKVLEILVGENLLRGKKLGVDATTLQANASMRALIHNVSGKSYREYVKSLMAGDPDEPDDPTPDEITRFDRRRKGKRLSNRQWKNPHNPDAKVTRMKDGRTHFAEKCEHAVDLETGAVVAVTVQGADLGDTCTMGVTLQAAAARLEAVEPALARQRKEEPRRPGRPPRREVIQCVVTDKGYHSAEVCADLLAEGIRPMLSEPGTKRRKWTGKKREQKAFYANRVHIRSEQGKGWLRKRGELVERAFAHYLDEGGMRRVWLKGHDNILKRLLLQVAGFNLGLVMRKRIGAATPRALAARAGALKGMFDPFFASTGHGVALWWHRHPSPPPFPDDYPIAEEPAEMPLAA